MCILYTIIIFICLLFFGSFFLPKKQSPTYGTASFAVTSRLLKRWNKGFKVGKKSLSSNSSTQHLLLCAPSGAGKTSSIIGPNIFHLLEKGHSMILTDPKSELTNLFSGWAREKLGIDVHILNILEPHKSITWNPLTSVVNYNYFGLMSEMYEITNAHINSESIWRVNTIEILVTLCKVLAIVEGGRYLNLSNLLYLLQHLQAFPDKTSSWLKQQEVNDMIKLSVIRFTNQDDKVFHGILSGAISVVMAFVPDEIKPLTNSTSLPDIKSFRQKQSVLILALPIGKEQVYQPYISLLLSNIFNTIIQTPTTPQDKYIAGIMEEFGQLHIPNYSSIISTVRSRKVMLLHCLQNIDQLSLRYGKDIAAIIADNCSHWLLLPSIKSQATLSYVRDSLLGTMTAIGNDRETSRSLLNNDEIRRLKDDTILMVSSNYQPILLKLRPLYKAWRLLRRYGLKNRDGQLVSKYPTVEHMTVLQEIQYINLNEGQETESDLEIDATLMDFRRRLAQLAQENEDMP